MGMIFFVEVWDKANWLHIGVDLCLVIHVLLEDIYALSECWLPEH